MQAFLSVQLDGHEESHQTVPTSSGKKSELWTTDLPVSTGSKAIVNYTEQEMPPNLAFHPSDEKDLWRNGQVVTLPRSWSPNEVVLTVAELVALRSAAAEPHRCEANVVGILAAEVAAQRARSPALAASRMRHTRLDNRPPRKLAQRLLVAAV